MVSPSTSTLPRLGLPLRAPGPRLAREWLSTRDHHRWPPAPAGHARPAMLIPGFLAGDQSLTRMAQWLRGGGWSTARSGVNWNVDHMERVVTGVERRLEQAVQAGGSPALLVGQSRGGCVARAIAVRRPELVQTVVALGSPLRDQLAIRPQTWASVLSVAALGSLGVPGMFGAGCLRGSCCAEVNAAVTAPLPAGVRLISVYSRSDEVVRWEACLDPEATQLEVDASHIGMGVARGVWSALAVELAV